MDRTRATAGLDELNDVLWAAVEAGATRLPAARGHAALLDLCPAEICGVHRPAGPLGDAPVEMTPDNRRAAEMARMTSRHALAHPVLAHYLTTRDLRMLSPEDVDAAWQRHWVRGFMLSTVGVSEQVTIPVGFRGGVLTSYTLGRSGTRFSRIEREPLARAMGLLVRAQRIVEAQAGPSAAPVSAVAACLTVRELEVVRGLATGDTRVAVAHRLGISPRTVGKHLEHVNAKLGTGSLVEVLHRLTATPG